jgi:hypothetical protein
MATYEVTTDKGVYQVDTEDNQPTKPSVQPQNILGQLFNVPGAAMRGGIQSMVQGNGFGQGYQQGAMQPDQVPKFQNMAIDAVQKSADPSINAIVGMPASAVGMAADVATNPADLLGLLIGKTPIGAGKTLGGAIAESPVGQAVSKVANADIKPPDMSKMAGKIVNSLIKPSHANFMFGSNPGMGIAKEGIVANSMEDLLTKVSDKADYIQNAISTIRATPENVAKTVDLQDSLVPLKKVYIELRKAPKTHSAEIQQVTNAIEDLSGADPTKLNGLSVSDAYNIKGIVSKMQSWKSESAGGKMINSALKQVYRNVDTKIDKAIPELEELNVRMANMISAKQAIEHRVELLQKQEPANWSHLINLPFAAARSPYGKTLLGKLLAKSVSYRK